MIHPVLKRRFLGGNLVAWGTYVAEHLADWPWHVAKSKKESIPIQETGYHVVNDIMIYLYNDTMIY